MNLLRLPAVIAVWIGAAAAFRTFCLKPYQCNIVDKSIESRTLPVLEGGAIPYSVSAIAHANLEKLEPCMKSCEAVNRYMIAAANHRMLNQPAAAAALYQQALRCDRRPEIYLNLGETQVESGEIAGGTENLVIACTYNPELMNDITVQRSVVEQRVYEFQRRMRDQQLQNER